MLLHAVDRGDATVRLPTDRASLKMIEEHYGGVNVLVDELDNLMRVTVTTRNGLRPLRRPPLPCRALS